MSKSINNGQSMFEVVIAIFIISMIIVGIVSLSTISLSNSVFSRNKNLAGKYSQEAIEWLRGQREANLALFKSQAIGTYCLSSLDFSSNRACGANVGTTIFKREVIFTSLQIGVCPGINCKNIIQADVKTYWTDSKGYHEAKSVTNFSDIREK